ncbi:MAG: twin-arginine translocase subunit TatC [Polyangiaceae bacterium]|nr:twin-arginine translocase subunit TatC [Polyangiaceae bacterium]
MTFWEHLDELRKRVVRSLLGVMIGAIIAWEYREWLMVKLAQPFIDTWKEKGLAGEPSLHFGSPEAAFTAYFNLSLIGGIAFAAPWISYQIWSFVAPGLYAREKKYIIPFALGSSALFIGGGYVGYLTAFRVTFGFFLTLSGPIEGGLTVVPTIMMADFISFVMKMLIGFGIIFEIPVAFTGLALVGVVTHRKLIRWARYYIFGAFFLAAVLTPPEVSSMLVMAVPAVGLYFLSIGLVYIFQRKEAVQADIEAEKEREEEKKEKEREEAERKKREEENKKKAEQARKKVQAARKEAEALKKKLEEEKRAAEEVEKADAADDDAPKKPEGD